MRALTFLVAVAILAVAGFALWERPPPGEAPLSREVAPGLTVPADPSSGGGASSPSGPGAPPSVGGGAPVSGEDDAPAGVDTPPDDGAGDTDASADRSSEDVAPTVFLRDVHDAEVVVTGVRPPACVLDLPCEQDAATGNLTFPVPARTVGVTVLAWWNGTSVPALRVEVSDATGVRVAERASYPPLRFEVAAPWAPGPWTVTVAGANGGDVQLAGDVHLRAVVTRAS